jgi:hypothetical protein
MSKYELLIKLEDCCEVFCHVIIGVFTFEVLHNNRRKIKISVWVRRSLSGARG